MAPAVFLLLCGILAAEVALFGIQAAGLVGALLLAGAALILAKNRDAISR